VKSFEFRVSILRNWCEAAAPRVCFVLAASFSVALLSTLVTLAGGSRITCAVIWLPSQSTYYYRQDIAGAQSIPGWYIHLSWYKLVNSPLNIVHLSPTFYISQNCNGVAFPVVCSGLLNVFVWNTLASSNSIGLLKRNLYSVPEFSRPVLPNRLLRAV
jgi:hypothetical protein